MIKLKKPLFILFVAAIFSGCTQNNKHSQPAPKDFIVRQDSTALSEQLNALNEQHYVVRFKPGKDIISEKEKEKLVQWVNETQPGMITVRGTGGAARYKELGEQRMASTIYMLHDLNAGVDVITVDYDAAIPGGRAVIDIVPDMLAQQIRELAPILIIKTQQYE